MSTENMKRLSDKDIENLKNRVKRSPAHQVDPYVRKPDDFSFIPRSLNLEMHKKLDQVGEKIYLTLPDKREMPTGAEQSISKTIVIQDLNNSQLELISPLYIHLEYDGKQWIAYSYDLAIFGTGMNEFEAVNNYRIAIAELYLELKGIRLGTGLVEVLEFLKNLIREKQ